MLRLRKIPKKSQKILGFPSPNWLPSVEDPHPQINSIWLQNPYRPKIKAKMGKNLCIRGSITSELYQISGFNVIHKGARRWPVFSIWPLSVDINGCPNPKGD